MADAYWRYGESRHPPPSSMPSLVGKRPRTDYDLPGSHDLPSYYPRDDDRGGIRDTDSIGASYDRYLHGSQMSSYSGGQSARPMGNGISSRDDPRIMSGGGGGDPGPSLRDRKMGFGGGRPETLLPPNASSMLFVEGLPSDCSRREVSPGLTDIFRPFVGYKEVRLVSKDSRLPDGDPLILCFVDFVSPAHAATALDALQGYKFDEHDRDSFKLRLQFARFPGARSGGGPPRGKR